MGLTAGRAWNYHSRVRLRLFSIASKPGGFGSSSPAAAVLLADAAVSPPSPSTTGAWLLLLLSEIVVNVLFQISKKKTFWFGVKEAIFSYCRDGEGTMV